MAYQPGEHLLHYRILGPLGSGGMGDVYRAEDTRLKREVALKVLPAEMAADPERRQRFEREAQAVAALNHPNIVTIHAVEQAGDIHFLTMELIDGEPLSRFIAPSGVPLDDFFRIAVPLADALAAAHQRGITHRDLKPDNVMRTRDGRVKVLDFGLAKIGGALTTTAPDAEATAMATATVTEAGRIMGTIAYMSPEQAEGKPVDARSDVFSLGIVLYQMATGHQPFRGDSSISTITAILRDTPPPVTERNASLPNHLGRIVNRCLMKDPDRRYQTAGDLRNELEQLQAEVLSASSTPTITPPPANVKRPASRLLVGAVLGAMALVMGAILWLQVGTGRLPAEGSAALRQVEASVAVLPFASLGSDGESLTFSSGIHNDLLIRLSKIGALKVISRTSVMEYRDTTRSLRQIADELGVATIVEGSVQRSGNRMRLNARLVNARNDESLWAETYDRELTTDSIFDIQEDVAGQIAAALKARLTPQEEQQLRARPTENLEAYQAYLTAVEYQVRSEDETDQRIALQLLERAVSLDPGFAVAHAKLSLQHSLTFWDHSDRTPRRLQMARQAFEMAEQLSPGLPEVRTARGYYLYWGFLDYDGALAEFAEAAKTQPNETNVMAGIAYVMRRQGRLTEAAAKFRRLIELNPRDAIGIEALMRTQLLLRNIDEAKALARRLLQINPAQANVYAALAMIALRADGDLTQARQFVERGLDLKLSGTEFRDAIASVAIVGGDVSGLLKRLEAHPEDAWIDDDGEFVPKSLVAARAYALSGQPQPARAHYEATRTLLEERLRQHPDDPRVVGALGLTYAGLGRKQDAIRLGLRAVQLMPYERDALGGPRRIQDLADIYAHLGEPDLAIDRLEFLLDRPGPLTRTYLKLDPTWAPLRDHPRFRRLVGDSAPR